MKSAQNPHNRCRIRRFNRFCRHEESASYVESSPYLRAIPTRASIKSSIKSHLPIENSAPHLHIFRTNTSPCGVTTFLTSFKLGKNGLFVGGMSSGIVRTAASAYRIERQGGQRQCQT